MTRLEEQIVERRRELVMLLAQSNRDRDYICTAREQIAQLEDWLSTLERSVQEKDRAVAEINAELDHLGRLGEEPTDQGPQVVRAPPRRSAAITEPPIPAPEPPVMPPVTTSGGVIAAPPPAAMPTAPVAPPVAVPTGEDTREFSRKSVCARVEVEGDSNFFVGFSQNISEGGLFVATYDTMPEGTRCRLLFTLPTHPAPISATVEVMWVREFQEGQELPHTVLPGMGLRFLEVGDEERRAIARFTHLREPMFLPMD